MKDVYVINYLLSITLILAAVTGLLKWGKIKKEDRPIIVGWWLVIAVETIRFISILLNKPTLIPYNIYVLPLMWLYVWQFHQWKVIPARFTGFLIGTLSLLWFMDYFVIDGYSLDKLHYSYRLALSFTLVILSVTSMNIQIIEEKRSLIKNYRFLICLGITVYYTYRVLVDVFTLSAMSREFMTGISTFNRYLIQFYYLLLFLAALWIPRKKNFLHQY